MPKRVAVFALVLAFAFVGGAFAQGTQTGVLSGAVTSSDGALLPGVTVTIKSPAMIGTRSAVSDANGGYIFKALPPGVYKVTYELTGFTTVERTATIVLGGDASANATLAVATVQESVVVTAEAPSVLATTQVGANYKYDTINTLPTGRTLAAIAELAPGLTNNTPNGGQVTIAGNFAYDNVFLVDGVDVNDNVFGTANNLFIEDAIEETQILTSGISAEYGRFGGGVINAVTKRGGNTFSGSYRLNFTNPSWISETPVETQKGIKHESKLNKFHEATLGGPIVKDRVWFFLAGRLEKSDTATTLKETGLPFTSTRDQKRIEAKVTGNITSNHTLQATYTKNKTDDHRLTFTDFTVDLHGVINPSFPNDLFVVNYSGVLKSNLFAEAQFSKKKQSFSNFGGTSSNIVDSPYLALSVLAHYNAPYFDSTDPEDRNNRQIAGALSYFLSTKDLGRHDIKGGVEQYRGTRTGGNSQTATGFVFYADYVTDDSGAPVFDSNGFLIPIFSPGETLIEDWLPVKGARLDLTTLSFYLNDKWALNNHWSFMVGGRYERVRSKATGGIVGVDTDTFVPRLAASFDPKGDGKWKLDATYAHYAGKYNEAQFGNNTNVGNPDYTLGVYVGPPGEGRAFGPGIDPNNYATVAGTFPTANVFFDKGLSSPVTKEFGFAAGASLGKGGYLKAIYTNRKVKNFVEDFQTLDTGSTTIERNGINFGTFTNIVYRNSDLPVRNYQGLQFQAGYHVTDRWSVEGHYTVELKNEGNFEGEATNQPGITTRIGDYPEIFNEARNFPIGRLSGYQKNKVRLWTTYDIGLGKGGDVNLGVLYRYNSPLTYSLRSSNVPLTAIQQALGAAYASLPSTQTLFYSAGKGSEFFEASHLLDASLNYAVPVFKSAKPWVKAEVRNLFNKTPLTSFNTTVRPNSAGPRDELGLPTTFTKGSSFGKATSNANFPIPREFRVTVGFRF